MLRVPVLPKQCLQISGTHNTLRVIDTPDETVRQAVQRIECLLRAIWAVQSRSGAGSSHYFSNRARRRVPLPTDRRINFHPGTFTHSQSSSSADFGMDPDSRIDPPGTNLCESAPSADSFSEMNDRKSTQTRGKPQRPSFAPSRLRVRHSGPGLLAGK